MSAILKLVEDSFVEDVNVRDQYISRIDVLEKVKTLSMLPDNEHMTVKMVADFYDVDYNAVAQILGRHRKEFESDGVRTIKKNKDVAFDKLSKALPIKQNVLKLIPKKSVLRIGMLLRDSEIAKEVRNYLLKIEEVSTKETKELITGAWTNDDIITLNKILNDESNSGNTDIMTAIRVAAKELKRKQISVYQKFHTINKKHGSLNKYIVENNLLYMNKESYEAVNENDNKIVTEEISHVQLSEVSSKLSIIENQLNIVNDLNNRIHLLESEMSKKDILINEHEGLILRKNKVIDKYKKENSSLKADFAAMKRILLKINISNEGEQTKIYMKDRDGNISLK